MQSRGASAPEPSPYGAGREEVDKMVGYRFFPREKGRESMTSVLELSKNKSLKGKKINRGFAMPDQ